MQKETILYQTLQERVMANRFVNKVDHFTPKLQMVPEGMHDRFRNVIENVKAFIATYDDALTGDVMAATEKDTVTFDNDMHGQADFSLEDAAGLSSRTASRIALSRTRPCLTKPCRSA